VIIYIRVNVNGFPYFRLGFRDPSRRTSDIRFQEKTKYHFVFMPDSSVQCPNPAYVLAHKFVDHIIDAIFDVFRRGPAVDITLVGYEKWARHWCEHIENDQSIPEYCSDLFLKLLRTAADFDNSLPFGIETRKCLSLQTTDEYWKSMVKHERHPDIQKVVMGKKVPKKRAAMQSRTAGW
jgi:hypothetical protein